MTLKGRVHSWFEREEAERAAWAVGLERGDVDITLDDNVLTIRAEKKQEAEDRDRNYHVTECAYGVLLPDDRVAAGRRSIKRLCHLENYASR